MRFDLVSLNLDALRGEGEREREVDSNQDPPQLTIQKLVLKCNKTTTKMLGLGIAHKILNNFVRNGQAF